MSTFTFLAATSAVLSSASFMPVTLTEQFQVTPSPSFHAVRPRYGRELDWSASLGGADRNKDGVRDDIAALIGENVILKQNRRQLRTYAALERTLIALPMDESARAMASSLAAEMAAIRETPLESRELLSVRDVHHFGLNTSDRYQAYVARVNFFGLTEALPLN